MGSEFVTKQWQKMSFPAALNDVSARVVIDKTQLTCKETFPHSDLNEIISQ